MGVGVGGIGVAVGFGVAIPVGVGVPANGVPVGVGGVPVTTGVGVGKPGNVGVGAGVPPSGVNVAVGVGENRPFGSVGEVVLSQPESQPKKTPETTAAARTDLAAAIEAILAEAGVRVDASRTLLSSGFRRSARRARTDPGWP